MLIMLRTATVLLGLPLLLLGLGWWVHPGPAADLLGATLLEGTGRSTQIGDSAAFFIGSGALLIWGAIRCNATLLTAGGTMIGLVAPGRIISAEVHGGAWTSNEIMAECVIFLIALYTAFQIKESKEKNLFH